MIHNNAINHNYRREPVFSRNQARRGGGGGGVGWIGHPPPPPPPAKKKKFHLRYAPDCSILVYKLQKLPRVGGGTSPSLGRFAPSSGGPVK